MGKKSLTLIITGLLISQSSILAFANENLPPKLMTNKTQLKRCSQGELKAFRIIHVGYAALYLNGCDQLNNVLSPEPKNLRFLYERNIPANAFQEAAVEYLQLNLGRKYDTWQATIEKFNQAYQAVKDGDYYDLSYHPKEGLTLALNGTQLATIDNPEIGLAYLNIWFGKEAFSENLKAALLTPERI